jgi:hypothetical protein
MEPFENDSSSTTTQVSSPGTALDIIRHGDVFKTFLASAFFWFGFGLKIIPIMPGSKIPLIKWDPWLDSLGPEKIGQYWKENPTNELGFIVGDDMIVIDADSSESIAALKGIEERFELTPKLLVKTRQGEHHYYRRAAGTVAKSDSHSTEKHPERLDIKTGRAFVVLPPSTGKIIEKIEATGKDDLSEVSQDFIDAIYIHNGRPAPSTTPEVVTRSTPHGEVDDAYSEKIGALLKWIDPDCGYEDWLHVGMAIFHQTQGADEGRDLFDSWSSKGKKYGGRRDIETKWKSFRPDVANPVTIATLVKKARESGADVDGILCDVGFTSCEYEVIDPGKPSSKVTKPGIPLDRYTLLGRTEELEKQAVEQVPVLGCIALLGQATVIYARPNTGKTLIVLSLVVDAIRNGRVNPAYVYYVNMDDTGKGLVEKNKLADEYGFHMLADGHRGFEARTFRDSMEKMIEENTARGVIVILDTLKKFVNTMDKGKSSDFAKVIRRFAIKGGTVIALAHTNKNPNAAGKPVFSGTSDIVDDFDCAYTVDTVSEDPDTNQKVVEFSNFKRRGNVALSAAYSYALGAETPYDELLLSVQEYDEFQLIPLKRAVETMSDSAVIEAIEECIRKGTDKKMELARTAAKNAGVSHKKVLKIIEKYTGEEPDKHRWAFEVKEHGTKVFRLLERPAEQPPGPAITSP